MRSSGAQPLDEAIFRWIKAEAPVRDWSDVTCKTASGAGGRVRQSGRSEAAAELDEWEVLAEDIVVRRRATGTDKLRKAYAAEEFVARLWSTTCCPWPRMSKADTARVGPLGATPRSGVARRCGPSALFTGIPHLGVSRVSRLPRGNSCAQREDFG